MRERRSEIRAAIMARIEACWEDQTGGPHVATAKLEDKSRAGASIRVKESIPVGAKVSVKWHDGEFSGTVIYCRRTRSEYVLGIHKNAPDIPNPD
jgi:uncharacterized OB-fold protein